MKDHVRPAVPSPSGGQNARIDIRIGKRAGMTAEVTVTTRGLLAIGALVSSILLSSAVIVRAAQRPN